MARYFTRAAIVPEPMVWENTRIDTDGMKPSLCAADFEPTDTGLIDVRGDPIMRAPNPIGFGKDGDW